MWLTIHIRHTNSLSWEAESLIRELHSLIRELHSLIREHDSLIWEQDSLIWEVRGGGPRERGRDSSPDPFAKAEPRSGPAASATRSRERPATSRRRSTAR